jgi:hypothetical protein
MCIMRASSLTVTPGFWRIRLSASSAAVAAGAAGGGTAGAATPGRVDPVERFLGALQLEVLLVKRTELFESLLYLGALLCEEVSHCNP